MPLAVRVDRPGEVGADRLVNALAAGRLYGTPAVVVDFGTATTFDCVAADGAYVGGAIAPGLELGLEALAARTAKLPRIELRAPDRAIGRDTVSAIQSGTVLGYQALVERPARADPPRARRDGRRRARRRPGDPDRRPVGGAVGAGARGVDAIDPDLTLKGLAILHAEVAGGEPPRAGPAVTGRLDGTAAIAASASPARSPPTRRSSCSALLRAEGADVVVMLTPVGDPVRRPAHVRGAVRATRSRPTSLDLLPDGRIGHIVVADTADAIVVAPATAHWLGAMANGLAGDVVTATCLASSAPVVVAPAMDGDMWTHPATRANVARLRDDFGYTIVEPEAGPLASGQSGVGRLAELGRDRRRRRRGGRPTDRSAPPTRPRARRSSSPAATPTSTAGTSSSPPAARASRSTRSASSATARPGKMGVAIARGGARPRRARDAHRRQASRSPLADGDADGRPGRVHRRPARGAPAG